MGILNMNDLQDNNEKQGVTGVATGNVSTASADLINAENNAFPVTANSQIIISTQTCFDYISEYYTKGDAESSFFEGELIAEETYGGISSETATVTIYKNRITSVPVNYKIVTVPRMNYIAVHGKGDPNDDNGEYKNSIALLYAIAFTVNGKTFRPLKKRTKEMKVITALTRK